MRASDCVVTVVTALMVFTYTLALRAEPNWVNGNEII